MTKNELLKKRLQFLFLVAYFMVGYFACNIINMHRDHYYDVSFPFEASIPFMPFFITGYTSVYIALILIYAVIDDYQIFKKGFYLFLSVCSIHFLIFLLIPVKMVRPDLSEATGVMNALTRYYYLIDNPVNCFPSLHVAYPLIGTIILWNYKRAWGYVLAALTLFIAASVLLVKQHYLMDVIGAVVVTFSVYFILKAIRTSFPVPG